MVRGLFENPRATLIIGLVIGLIIGLPVLGWNVWPTEWKNADPTYLSESYKVDYLRMTVESYSVNENKELALQRWNALGEEASTVLKSLEQSGNIPGGLDTFKTVVQAGAVDTTLDETGILLPQTTPESPNVNLGVALGVSCVLLIAIGAALVYFLFIKKPSGGRKPKQARPVVEDYYAGEDYADTAVVEVGHPMVEQPAPVAQFMTTYAFGDDLYDDSFSIDTQSGEFLGECGVGISDTVGQGDPKKVTAFEVWLFDKNDIQTITKVLMSEYAINDSDIRQKLESKGEPVLLDPGNQVVLETKTLILEASVVEMHYGQGALPQNSFLDKVVLELQVWPKPAG